MDHKLSIFRSGTYLYCPINGGSSELRLWCKSIVNGYSRHAKGESSSVSYFQLNEFVSLKCPRVVTLPYTVLKF